MSLPCFVIFFCIYEFNKLLYFTMLRRRQEIKKIGNHTHHQAHISKAYLSYYRALRPGTDFNVKREEHTPPPHRVVP